MISLCSACEIDFIQRQHHCSLKCEQDFSEFFSNCFYYGWLRRRTYKVTQWNRNDFEIYISNVKLGSCAKALRVLVPYLWPPCDIIKSPQLVAENPYRMILSSNTLVWRHTNCVASAVYIFVYYYYFIVYLWLF